MAVWIFDLELASPLIVHYLAFDNGPICLTLSEYLVYILNANPEPGTRLPLATFAQIQTPSIS